MRLTGGGAGTVGSTGLYSYRVPHLPHSAWPGPRTATDIRETTIPRHTDCHDNITNYTASFYVFQPLWQKDTAKGENVPTLGDA